MSVIYIVGGIVTVPVTVLIVRRLPFQTTRLALRMLTNCILRQPVRRVHRAQRPGRDPVRAQQPRSGAADLRRLRSRL